MPYISSVYRLCDGCGLGGNDEHYVQEALGQCDCCGYPMDFEGSQLMTATLASHPIVELRLYGKLEISLRGRWIGTEPAVAFFVESVVKTHHVQSEKTFFDRYINGEVDPDSIHNSITEWHLSDSTIHLHTYLGLSWDEYKSWVECKKTLLEIKKEREIRGG